MDRHYKSAILPVAASVISAAASLAFAADNSDARALPSLSQPPILNSESKTDIEGLSAVTADRFSINYEIDPQSMKYVSRIELWCGKGKSGPWQLYDYDLDRTPPVDFTVASEGVWRFLIVPVDVNGIRYFQGSSGNTAQASDTIPASVPPQTTLFVDYTKPQIFMHEPLIQNLTNGEKLVVIQWNVFDNFLADSPAQLYWIEAGGQQWHLLGDSLKSFDSFSWNIPDSVKGPVCFKLTCSDKAGNVEEAVTKLVYVTPSETYVRPNPYDTSTYAIDDQSQYQGLPQFQTDSPLVSTDIGKAQQPSDTITPDPEKFSPRDVGIVPFGQGSQQNSLTTPTYDQNYNLNQQAMPDQSKYLVEPAVKKMIASAPNNLYTEHKNPTLNGRAADYLQLGMESYDRGEYERARMLFEQVVAMEPSFIPAYYQLADVLYLQGKFEMARDNFNIFLEKYPNHRKALLGLMYCDLKLGDLENATIILNKVNQVNENDEHWGDLLK